MLPTTTIDGRLVADPELRFTAAGRAVCSFRVAASENKKNDQGGWDDGDRIFIGVSMWEADGEQAAEDLRKGDRVLISGRLYEREYDKSDGTKGRSLEVKFPTVAKVVAGRKQQGQGQGQQRQAAPTQASDPWGGRIPDSEPPF